MSNEPIELTLADLVIRLVREWLPPEQANNIHWGILQKQLLKTLRDLPVITAAPKLLEALKDISALWPEPPDCVAINPQWLGPNDGQMRAIGLEAAINIARRALAKAEGR